MYNGQGFPRFTAKKFEPKMVTFPSKGNFRGPVLDLYYCRNYSLGSLQSQPHLFVQTKCAHYATESPGQEGFLSE